ncbi:pentatricopeptide repeat-containing protein 2, mitochondrial [Caerostris darwini]|uniref:Pentatricopeptide repeat-containing protein 2, mitochondrial n=1 Tax=Caerostris darwini TaxID=1538125 RepID=A0AAV4PLK1_9ARAC|nr:pentatricopeptide repeat-containing protein 2, mitochondrial [Caerostris darwini]
MNSLRRITGNSILSKVYQESRRILSVRFLYNEPFLGLDKYAEARQRTSSRLGSMRENFYNRMKSQLSNPAKSMIFTEDLKTVIHSCDDNPEELELCVQMMKRFHKQNKELRFGTFIFGPVALRLFYHLQKTDLMGEVFNDPELDGFFDQLKSYLLCMNLCFKNGKYSEVIKSFEECQQKKLGDSKFPREVVVLTTGACYKLNTPESFQLATNIVTQAREGSFTILRKSLNFVAALALQQNKPDVALEILSSMPGNRWIVVNNLRLTALTDMNRIQDVFTILREVVEQNITRQQRPQGEICQSTLDHIKQAVDSANDKETSHTFEQLARSLTEGNCITSRTMDDLLCVEIRPRPFPRDDNSSYSFGRRNDFSDGPFRERERQSFSGDSQPGRRRFAGLAEEF